MSGYFSYLARLSYILIGGYEHFSDTDKKKCKGFAQLHIGRAVFYIGFGKVQFCVEENNMMKLLITWGDETFI